MPLENSFEFILSFLEINITYGYYSTLLKLVQPGQYL